MPLTRWLQLWLDRNMACADATCVLCRNNPRKACDDGQLLDDVCVINEPLRAKCGGDLHVDVGSGSATAPGLVPGAELQVPAREGPLFGICLLYCH